MHPLVHADMVEDTLSHAPQRWQVRGRWEVGDQGKSRGSQKSSMLFRRESRSPA